MQIYLPIAEVTVNVFLLVGIGGVVGFLSGMFGVGGGFLITPLLFFIGVPPGVAVATGANQVVASSVSGMLAQMRRKAVDFRMGTVLLSGGFVGSALGIWLFAILKRLGQIDLLIQLLYVVFLGFIGLMMLQESVRAMWRTRRKDAPPPRARNHPRTHHLPFRMRFRASGLYISVIPPLLIGAVAGVLSALMGVGGGFMLVPAMIYLLGMPTRIVIGTSLFQIIFVSGFTTVMHAIANHSVDMLLAFVLIIGGVVGAQLGVRFGARMKAEQLRVLLSLLVIIVALRISGDLLLTPTEFYAITSGVAG